jgi:hypothetical protein
MALDELNSFRWKFLGVRGDDIASVAGTDLYTLPAPMKSPISLMLSTSPNRKLTHVSREDWDAVVRSSVGGTYFYTDYLVGQTGQIQLLDAPDSAGTLEIRYLRGIMIPAADETLLDVKDGPMTNFVINRAKQIVAGDRGVFANRVEMYERWANRALAQAWGEDNVGHDDVPQVLPYAAWADGRAVNINSPDYWAIQGAL